MATVLLGIAVFAIFFLLMSVRVIFVKDGAFKGTCASQNPILNKNGEVCGYCGKAPGSCETEIKPAGLNKN
jgi:hypothetical protein